ncbi:MAG TPA: DUF459 domain-containing protein [Parvibaculum sp.]
MAGRSSFFLRIFTALAFGALFAPALAAADPLSITPPVPGSSSLVKATLTTTETAPDAATPAKEHYNVVVFGDSLGDGVWAGLYHVLHKDKRFSVIRKSRVATGFVRQDYYDWNQAVRDAAADTKIDIAVVVMGTNDRQTIVEDGARYALFEPKWREIYEARIDDFTETLKKSGARIYWVGLPVMRSATFESDMETFTQIFESRAKANDVTFIPTHDIAADKEGKYDAYRTDASGRKRLLRAEDGIHFTMDGYELLARAIGGEITADVDSGAVASRAPVQVLSAAAREAAKAPVSTASIGLKTQVYDLAEVRPGRSDDWRWNGAAR